MSWVREGGTRDWTATGKMKGWNSTSVSKGCWTGVSGVNRGGTLEMTLPFFEDTAVISNVNWRGFFFFFIANEAWWSLKNTCVCVCIDAKWLLCLQAPAHVSGEYRSSSTTLIYHCLKAQRLHSNCQLFPFFIYPLDSYGAEGIIIILFNTAIKVKWEVILTEEQLFFFLIFFLGLHYFFPPPPSFFAQGCVQMWRCKLKSFYSCSIFFFFLRIKLGRSKIALITFCFLRAYKCM